jgi:hypothetical protein
VYELPRPREGPRAVDAFMIPLLDEEVAYEVLRYKNNNTTEQTTKLPNKQQNY